MASSVKACTNSRYRKTNIVIITILSLLSCFALVMVIYNLIKGSYLFSIAWFIATILASTYVLIRINTVFATYISTDRMNLFMKNWNNDFLPYDYDNKVKILSEFIPAKTKIVEIPLNEISKVLIGTKNFIKRNVAPDSDFVKNIRVLEKSKDFYKKKTNNDDFSINYSSPDECNAAIAQYEQDVLEEGDSIVEGSEAVNITLEPQVAMTVIDQSTGEVKALVGGRGDKSGNRSRFKNWRYHH